MALQKCILSPAQLAAFETSETRRKVVSYIEILNESIIGAKLTDECPETEVGLIDYSETSSHLAGCPIDSLDTRRG